MDKGINDYLVMVCDTEDKVKIADGIVGNPTLSNVSKSYNRYAKFCALNNYAKVSTRKFMAEIKAEYGLSVKQVGNVHKDGSAVTKVTFVRE